MDHIFREHRPFLSAVASRTLLRGNVWGRLCKECGCVRIQWLEAPKGSWHHNLSARVYFLQDKKVQRTLWTVKRYVFNSVSMQSKVIDNRIPPNDCCLEIRWVGDHVTSEWKIHNKFHFQLQRVQVSQLVFVFSYFLPWAFDSLAPALNRIVADCFNNRNKRGKISPNVNPRCDQSTNLEKTAKGLIFIIVIQQQVAA